MKSGISINFYLAWLRSAQILLCGGTLFYSGCVVSHDVMIPLPLYVAAEALSPLARGPENGKIVAQAGNKTMKMRDAIFMRSVSENFKAQELQLLLERLSSEKFRSDLEEFSLGQPVPRYQFGMELRERAKEGKQEEGRWIIIGILPDPYRNNEKRYLVSGMEYLIGEILDELDPQGSRLPTRHSLGKPRWIPEKDRIIHPDSGLNEN